MNILVHVSREQSLGAFNSFSFVQCCGSGSGFGRIRPFLVTRIRIRKNSGSGSGSFIHKKTPCNLIFLVKYHCLKYSLVQRIFIFDFKCHKMIRFGKKMPFKTYLSRIRIRSDPAIFGSSGSGSVFKKPDPRIRIRKKMDRIRNTGFKYDPIYTTG